MPAEAVEILGETTCQAIEDSVAALEELGELAATEDPFKDKTRPSDINLDSLKPKHAEIVRNFGSSSKPFKGLRHMQISKFARKVGSKVRGLDEDMRDRCKFAENSLGYLEEDIETAQETLDEEGREDSAVDILRSAMESVFSTAQRVPSKASYQTVENTYLAAIAGQELRRVNLATKNPITSPSGWATDTVGKIIEEVKLRLSGYRELEGTINGLSQRGSGAFEALSQLIKIEQLSEVVYLLSVVDATKRLLPTADELEEGEQEAVLATEGYLTSQIDTVIATLRDTAPDILDEKVASEDLRRLGSSSLATELQQKELGRKRAEVGENVITGITDAKNVLRGGGRLEPAKGQSKKEVQQRAQDLHALRDGNDQRLLEREESGVIMATVTGHFETFREVIEKVKLHASNGNRDAFPADRANVIDEIKKFDLEGAMRKISAVLEDPNRRVYVEKILKPEELKRLKATVKEVLEPEDSSQSNAG